MSNQNNMISFITLNTDFNEQIELNPAFIVMMGRKELRNTVPYTKIMLTTGSVLKVMETPEQIAELQMQAVARTMGSLMPMFTDIMEELD